MLVLSFGVEGIPAPQGSKSAFVVNGRARLVEASGKKHKLWRQQVTDAAREAATVNGHSAFPLDGPLEVRVRFFMPVPKTVKVGEFHAKTPDVDKLARSVLDSLTMAGVWCDDSRVSVLSAEKVYAHHREPGCEVKVYRI